MFQSVKLEPSKSNKEILGTMENIMSTKINYNVKEDTNNITQLKISPNNKFIEIDSNKNSYYKGNENNLIFPKIISNRTIPRNKSEINDKEKDNSTFQETRSLEMIEKSGIYNTQKSEKSQKSIINQVCLSPKRQNAKKHYNLYTNCNPGYNMATSQTNLMGNTFITFSNNQKLLKSDSKGKISPIFTKEYTKDRNEERLIKKVYETNINTTNNNGNENESYVLQNKLNLENIIIKEKKDLVSPSISKQYCNVSSFENKLNSELGRISKTYGKIEARSKFNDDLLEKYIEVIPDYEKYRIVKILNNKDNYKFKLLPIILNKKNGFEKLGVKFFDNLKNNDPNYFDINKEWEDYLTKDKDCKLEEENKLNSLNFDFSKDYKKICEEEQDSDHNILSLKISERSKSIIDHKNLSMDKDILLNNKNSVSYDQDENDKEYKLE